MKDARSTSNIILQTALKTVIVIALVAVVTVFVLGLVMPGTMGDFWGSVGLNNLSLSYAKSQYERTSDINDLAVLIDRAVFVQNDELVVEYASQMLSERNYAAYCAHVDGLITPSDTGGTRFSYDHYVRGNIVLSLARLSLVSDALTACRAYMRFDEATLTYHGVGSYYLLSEVATLPDGIDVFIARASEVKGDIEALLTAEQDATRIAKLTDARRALYSEINGLLTLWGMDATDWSLS